MLKWILGISALVVVAILAVVYSPSYLLISGEKPAAPLVMDDNTRRFCKTFFKDSALIDDVMTAAQYDATCMCFAKDALKKAGNAPAGDINDAVVLQEVESVAQASIKKCAGKAGSQ